jgi:YihY family inner membrane protein
MGKLIRRITDAVSRWQKFLAHDIWRIGRPGEETPDGFFIQQIRVAILLIQNLVQDALMVRAAALTFTTALAIVPFFVVTIGILKSFDVHIMVQETILKAASVVADVDPDQFKGDTPNESMKLMVEAFLEAEGLAEADDGDPDTEEAQSPLQETLDFFWTMADDQERKLAAQGDTTEADGQEQRPPGTAEAEQENSRVLTTSIAIFLLAIVFGLMRNIEMAFNAIWGVKQSRDILRTISNYLLIVLLMPVLTFATFTLSVVLTTMGESLRDTLGPAAIVLQSIQYVVPCLVLTILYYVVPNTRVHARYALLAGIVTGVLWSVTSVGYLNLLMSSGRYDWLYGALAQFPLFLMWVYVSWVIVLFGAELSFAYQNVKTFSMERWADGASHAYREAVAVGAMIDSCGRFESGESGLEPVAAAEAWNVPTRLLNEVLDVLERAGLVRQCMTDPPTYQPARSIARITLGDVVTAMRESGRDPSALREDETLRSVLQRIDGLHDAHLASNFENLVNDWEQAQAPALTVVQADAVGESPPKGR